jgi:predicted SAM-dependent methyltransferase
LEDIQHLRRTAQLFFQAQSVHCLLHTDFDLDETEMNCQQSQYYPQRMDLQHAQKIVIGAGGISAPGWLATDKDTLDVVDQANFLRYWKPNSIEALSQRVGTLNGKRGYGYANCYEFLRPGGHLRVAVPDGFHPEPSYIEYVRPGGTGIGADDHKVLYNYQSLMKLLGKAGFFVHLLEYWDEHGNFHFKEWSSKDGHIRRSKRYDPRNQDGSLTYTSLIVDAVKPTQHNVLLEDCISFWES